MRYSAERVVGDVTILDLAGVQVFGTLGTEVSDRVEALTGQGRTKFLLNLQEVPYLDSSGLGDLAQAYQTAAGHGATLKLANVCERVVGLLQTVQLLRFFPIFASEQAALESFRQ
jgi:anti-sigma B factor antagonist